MNKGVVVLDENLEELLFTVNELSDLSVTTIYEDGSNGFWFATYDNGLYYTSNVDYKSLNSTIVNGREPLAPFIVIGDSILYTGTFNGYLIGVNSEFEELYKIPINNNYQRTQIKSLSYLESNNSIWLGTPGRLISYDLTTKDSFYQKFKYSFVTHGVIQESDSTILVLDRRGLVRGKLNKRIYDYQELVDDSISVYKGKRANDSTIVMLRNDRLVKFVDGKSYYYQHSLLNASILDFETLNDEVWAVSGKNGLLRVKGEEVFEIGEYLGLPKVGYKCIELYEDSLLFLGTINACYKIDLKAFPQKVVEYSNFDGLPKGEVKDIISFKGNIWMNINDKIWKTPFLNKDYNDQKHPLKIISLSTKDSTYLAKDGVAFDYANQTIKIQFTSLNYSQGGKVTYRCRLRGSTSSWVEVNSPEITFNSLMPNSYTFEVMTLQNNNEWSDVEEFRFEVYPLFWQTKWFGFSCLIVLFLIAYYLLYSRINSIQKKEAIKTQLIHLEMKALKAQLNPHFIFNSISSVQYYLAKNEPENASNYMGEFASLIRKVLEHSEKSIISVYNELELIKEYVLLEGKKFKNETLALVLEIEPDLDLRKIGVPPALFQPYVENSIWHGLKSKKGEKKITIRLKRNDKKLIIEVEDNGIGRLAANTKARRGKQNRSFGMSIASERIKALNGARKDKSIEIIDLHTEKGIALGTKVILTIPYTELHL